MPASRISAIEFFQRWNHWFSFFISSVHSDRMLESSTATFNGPEYSFFGSSDHCLCGRKSIAIFRQSQTCLDFMETSQTSVRYFPNVDCSFNPITGQRNGEALQLSYIVICVAARGSVLAVQYFPGLEVLIGVGWGSSNTLGQH